MQISHELRLISNEFSLKVDLQRGFNEKQSYLDKQFKQLNFFIKMQNFITVWARNQMFLNIYYFKIVCLYSNIKNTLCMPYLKFGLRK